MELYPKFIIEDGCLILGKVQYHKELVEKKENVRGGGWFRYLQGTDTFVFDINSTSQDFGRARLDDIKKCVSEKKVFDKARIRNLSDRHNFAYDTGTEIIELK